MAIADHGHLVLTGSADSSLLVWDLFRPPVISYISHPPGATSVYLSPCGTYGVSGGTDSAVKVYDMKTMEVMREIRSQNNDKAISQVLIQRDSEHVVVGYSDGAVKYWNGSDQTLLTTCKDTPPSAVSCIDLSPDGQLIMAGYVDSTVSCWSTKTGEKLKTLTNHSAPITAAAFCHDQILTASTDGQVDIRCYRTTKLTSSHRIHEEGLLCLSVSPNSKFFVSGTQRGACHVTHMKTGLLKTVLAGHRGPVTCVQVLQDFVHCLTVSEQGCIRMWDLESGSCITRLYVDGTVTSCCANMHFGGLIYGTDEGWVSAALYWTESGPDKAEFEGLLTTGLQSSWTSSSDDTNNSSVSGSRQTLTG